MTPPNSVDENLPITTKPLVIAGAFLSLLAFATYFIVTQPLTPVHRSQLSAELTRSLVPRYSDFLDKTSVNDIRIECVTGSASSDVNSQASHLEATFWEKGAFTPTKIMLSTSCKDGFVVRMRNIGKSKKTGVFIPRNHTVGDPFNAAVLMTIFDDATALYLKEKTALTEDPLSKPNESIHTALEALIEDEPSVEGQVELSKTPDNRLNDKDALPPLKS